MSDVRTEVKLYLEQHEPEGLAYIDCPECGNSDKLMLIPLDDGGTFYKCLRASCPTSGSVGSTYTKKVAPDVPKGRKTYEPYHALSTYKVGNQRFKNYRAQRLCSGTYVDSYGHLRYLLPIRDRLEQEVGYVARTYDSSEYKALVRPYRPSGSLLAWYRPNPQFPPKGQVVVLVEDQISAAKVAKAGLVSVALLGTTTGYLDEMELSNKFTVTVLDNDALADGRRLSRKLGGAFWPLPGPDLKDMGDVEFARFMDNVSTL